MKLTSALIAAVFAGVATFAGQHATEALEAPAGDAAGAGWRQMMLSRGAAVSVDDALANLTRNLDLTPSQAANIRPILQAHHDRIRNVLETAPALLTHEEFMSQVHAISDQTHDRVNALLTPRQRQLVKQLKTPARV